MAKKKGGKKGKGKGKKSKLPSTMAVGVILQPASSFALMKDSPLKAKPPKPAPPYVDAPPPRPQAFAPSPFEKAPTPFEPDSPHFRRVFPTSAFQRHREPPPPPPPTTPARAPGTPSFAAHATPPASPMHRPHRGPPPSPFTPMSPEHRIAPQLMSPS